MYGKRAILKILDDFFCYYFIYAFELVEKISFNVGYFPTILSIRNHDKKCNVMM